MIMNLKDKQFYRSIFELVFQNPEASKEVFTFVLDNVDIELSGLMKEILPLLNYVTTSECFDVEVAYNLGQDYIRHESLLSIFNATVSNNIEVFVNSNSASEKYFYNHGSEFERGRL